MKRKIFALFLAVLMTVVFACTAFASPYGYLHTEETGTADEAQLETETTTVIEEKAYSEYDYGYAFKKQTGYGDNKYYEHILIDEGEKFVISFSDSEIIGTGSFEGSLSDGATLCWNYSSLSRPVQIIYNNGKPEKLKIGSVYYVSETLDDGVDALELAVKTVAENAEKEEKANQEYLTKLTEIGRVVQFGTYEQDADESNGEEPIQWVEVAVNDGTSLLLSAYVLDAQKYGKTVGGSCTWEKSTLRKWLNSTFLNSAFTAEEQEKIIATHIENSEPKKETDTEAEVSQTDDKVFLLNQDQVASCIQTVWLLKTLATKSAKKNNSVLKSDEYCTWWLINAKDGKTKYCIDGDGKETTVASNKKEGVRPAILVYTDAITEENVVAEAQTKEPETTAAAPVVTETQTTEMMVWIPTNGGKKYHRKSTCSGMENPMQVTLSEAKAQGFEPCKKCYK